MSLSKYFKIFWNSTVAFRDTCKSARPIQPFWADFFALGSSNSEGHHGISKWFFLHHCFSSSFLSQKWCQISVRIFCVLSGTRNLQWTPTTDAWWLFMKLFIANIIFGVYLGLKSKVIFRKNNWMMEIMDMGLTVPK